MGALIIFAVVAVVVVFSWKMAQWFPYDDIYWHSEAQRMKREQCTCCPVHGGRDERMQ